MSNPVQSEEVQAVLDATEVISQQIDIIRRKTARGIRDDVKRSGRYNVNALKELVDVSKDIVKELKRLR